MMSIQLFLLVLSVLVHIRDFNDFPSVTLSFHDIPYKVSRISVIIKISILGNLGISLTTSIAVHSLYEGPVTKQIRELVKSDIGLKKSGNGYI